jgi:hypothetical protein
MNSFVFPSLFRTHWSLFKCKIPLSQCTLAHSSFPAVRNEFRLIKCTRRFFKETEERLTVFSPFRYTENSVTDLRFTSSVLSKFWSNTVSISIRVTSYQSRDPSHSQPGFNLGIGNWTIYSRGVKISIFRKFSSVLLKGYRP